MIKTVFLLWMFVFALMGMSAQKSTITLKVKGISEAKGIMNIAIFNSEEDYRSGENFVLGEKIEVNSNEFTFISPEIPVGTYAIKVFQDVDSNGEFNKNWIGMPKEPFGFSNDAKGRMGPPSFEDASFSLEGDTELVINLMEL